MNMKDNIKTLKVEAEIRYWEDGTVDDVEDEGGILIPCRIGEMWCPIIDVDSGSIKNWTKGIVAKIHYKVCDAGSYYLQDADGKTILSIENGYVPKIMCPKENGFGDYIIMDIDKDGKIAEWNNSDLEGFIPEED